MQTHVIKTLDVLVGLHGCGKTLWAKAACASKNKYLSMYKPKCHYIDMENIRNGPFGHRSDKDVIYLTSDSLKRAENIILEDYNITSTEKFLEFIMTYVTNQIVSIDEVVFHVWEPNVPACLYNSEGIISEEEMESLKIQTLDIKDLSLVESILKCKTKVVPHRTKQKPEWLHFCSIHGIKLIEDRFMYSESWSLGGCYYDDNGEASPAYPDDPPAEFQEFEDFVNKLCPSISLKNYRQLKESCTVETYSPEYDEDEIYHARYICDMQSFYRTFCEIQKEAKESAKVDIDITHTNDDVVGTLTFHGISEADVYEKIKAFRGDEIF